MAEQRSLADDPFFSQPILSQRPAGSLEREVDASQADIPPPPSGGDVMRDMGRSAVSGLAQGAAGTLVGGVGSVETFAAKDLPEMVRAGGAYLGEKMGVLSPDERKAISERPIYSGMTPEQQRGEAAPLSGLPTYKQVAEGFKPTMKAAGADVLAYEPQTAFGKTVSSGMEMGAQGLPGATKSVVGRFVTGFGVGSGSEIGALSAEDPDSVGYNKLAGALAGAGAGIGASTVAGKLYNGVKALAFSTKTAQNELVDMIASDIRRGVSPMTMQQFEEAQARGVPVTALDLAGPETRKRIGISAEKTPGAQEAAADYNAFLNQRTAETGQRVSGAIESVIGHPVNVTALSDAVEQAGKDVRNSIYEITRAEPAAQSIPNSLIGMDLISRPAIQDAMRQAIETAKNNPRWNIIPPKVVPGTPAREAQAVYGPSGFREYPAVPAGPSQVTNGNLAFWDQVKRELDSKWTNASAQRNTTEASTFLANKNDLVKKLDDTVKSYKETRDLASETFHAATAPEAGYNFLTKMDAFKRGDAVKAFNSYTPEQKELFAIGAAHRIGEMASTPGELSKLAKNLTEDKNFRSMVAMSLGPQRFEQIYGTLLSENVLSKAKELKFIEQQSGVTGAGMAGAAIGAGADAAMAGSLMLSPGMATNVILGAAAGAAGKTFMNAMERKIAAKIVPMATDPAQAAELGRLATSSPAVAQVLQKLAGIMNNRLITATSATNTVSDRTKRATGGRAGGMTADMLIKAAERAKKDIGKGTEALLSTPDAMVAKALAVANEKLEG